MIDATTPSVAVLLTCGDGLCHLGEERVQGEDPTTTTCTEDCPIEVGECAAPTTSDVGDATVPCGGNGGCNYATLTCNCAAAYAGDSCAYCAENYIRVGDECTVSVSALQAAAEEEEQPPAPSTPRVRPPCSPGLHAPASIAHYGRSCVTVSSS